MMGQQGGSQDRLFYSFNLDDHIPRNHLLRGIDCFFDLSELRTHLAPFYSHTGRPSIDPELMMRMLIVGYCFGIRSERRLCEEVHLNLAYRWFCRRDLEDAVPDHSTFSKNRHGRAARATPSVMCSRACCADACAKASFAAKASQLMPASSRLTPTVREVFQGPKPQTGARTLEQAARLANIWMRSNRSTLRATTMPSHRLLRVRTFR